MSLRLTNATARRAVSFPTSSALIFFVVSDMVVREVAAVDAAVVAVVVVCTDAVDAAGECVAVLLRLDDELIPKARANARPRDDFDAFESAVLGRRTYEVCCWNMKWAVGTGGAFWMDRPVELEVVVERVVDGARADGSTGGEVRRSSRAEEGTGGVYPVRGSLEAVISSTAREEVEPGCGEEGNL